jgi:hypothetical protein
VASDSSPRKDLLPIGQILSLLLSSKSEHVLAIVDTSFATAGVDDILGFPGGTFGIREKALIPDPKRPQLRESLMFDCGGNNIPRQVFFRSQCLAKITRCP